MKAMSVATMLLGWVVFSCPSRAQSPPDAFPLAGDWQGALAMQGVTEHLVLHMNTTPEGKMTALLDNTDRRISGIPAIGGSFDGTHLVLRFLYWKRNSDGDFEPKVAAYQATLNSSNSEMTGDWAQEGSSPLSFKRLTWHAKVPKPASRTIFDGNWSGIEYESRGIQIHFIFHIHNTEDGLMALLDCPEEKFKGALASKVTYDLSSRQISITVGQSIFAGTMTADGKSLDTSMTEPGFHFLIHFDRLPPANAAGN